MLPSVSAASPGRTGAGSCSSDEVVGFALSGTTWVMTVWRSAAARTGQRSVALIYADISVPTSDRVRHSGRGGEGDAPLSPTLILVLMTVLFLVFGYLGVPVAFSL